MQQQNVISDIEVSTTIAAQLACSFLIAGGAGLIMFCWLNSFGLTQVLVVILALACSLGAGLLATANIPYGLFLLRLTLTHLAEGKPISVPQSLWLWPLGTLFRSLAQAKLRIDEILQRERLANEYREQMLQRASEVAATEERNRLARDLHDSIKQQIFSIRMSALAAKGHVQVGVTKAQEALEDILKSTNEAQVEMQALLQQLRSAPLENISLAEAVQTQAQALEYRSGAQVSVEMATLPPLDRFTPHMQEILFRIAQESFANIAHHARAQHVHYIQAQDKETVTVIISDDGQGFDTQATHKGMGLANIQERVHSLDGTAKIESEPGKGTTLSIQIPLLLSPETKEQQEQAEYEAQRMIARAQGGLQLRSIIGGFTLVALITDLGLFTARRISMETKGLLIFILALCLFLMIYGLVNTHLAVARLKHYRDEEDRSLRALYLHIHRGWASFFRLVLFIFWQIMLWELPLLWGVSKWETELLFLLVAGSVLTLLLLEDSQAKRAQDRYYPLLPKNLLGWEIRERWRNMRMRIIFCLCVGIALLVNKSFP
ncbi:MAG: sensor histidine kinase, partial [Ktedonobacteraceae bacterium]|nr:sensor histidine kinase [Ktedonobacteraceae bacterium]